MEFKKINNSDKNLIQLWNKIEHKFCTDLNDKFTNKDIDGWLSHFLPFGKIDILQYGNGEKNNEIIKKISFSLSNIENLSDDENVIPARIMAKSIFNELDKIEYKMSKGKLLGIYIVNKDKAEVYARFKRYNKSDEIFQKIRVVYKLDLNNGNWFITGLTAHEDYDEAVESIYADKTWCIKE